MINVNYSAISNKLFHNYLDFLIGQVYKSLCLKEENSDTLQNYMESLRNELLGSIELIEFLKHDARYVSMLNKIQFLISEKNIDNKTFKKEIFSCINIIKKLKERYK